MEPALSFHQFFETRGDALFESLENILTKPGASGVINAIETARHHLTGLRRRLVEHEGMLTVGLVEGSDAESSAPSACVEHALTYLEHLHLHPALDAVSLLYTWGRVEAPVRQFLDLPACPAPAWRSYLIYRVENQLTSFLSELVKSMGSPGQLRFRCEYSAENTHFIIKLLAGARGEVKAYPVSIALPAQGSTLLSDIKRTSDVLAQAGALVHCETRKDGFWPGGATAIVTTLSPAARKSQKLLAKLSPDDRGRLKALAESRPDDLIAGLRAL